MNPFAVTLFGDFTPTKIDPNTLRRSAFQYSVFEYDTQGQRIDWDFILIVHSLLDLRVCAAIQRHESLLI